MILIVGSNKDDVLYFDSKLKSRKVETILKNYHVSLGTILNNPVVVLSDVYTDYLSASLLTYIIEKYHIILVFSVGKCRSFNGDLKAGTLAVSRQVYLSDVNEIGIEKTVLGQIPSLPPYFLPHAYLTSVVRTGLDRICPNDYKMAVFVSLNKNEKTRNDLADILLDDTLFGHKNNIVIDSETGGAFLAAQLYDIPCIAIKVVEGKLGEEISEEHLFDSYKAYPTIGKIITYCIGEISRNDMIEDNSHVG